MSVTLLLGLLGSIALGAVLVVIGLRGRRINDHPICRFCGFDLEGVVPGGVTCPECGAGLKRERAVRIGQRRRRPVVIAVGSAAALLPASLIGVVLFATLTGAELNSYKPLGLLLWEARSGSERASAAAAEEIHARYQRKALGEAQQARVVKEAMAIQRDPRLPWSERWGDVISAAHAAGAVDVDEWGEFCAHAPVIEWSVRPRVGAGEAIPIAAKLVEGRIGTNSVFWGALLVREAKVDGKRAQFRQSMQMAGHEPPLAWHGHVGWVQMMGSASGWGGGGGAGGQGAGGLLLELPEGAGPGEVEVQLTVDLKVLDQTAMNGMMVWPDGAERPEGPGVRTFELALPVQIVPAEAAAVRTIPADPETTERMLATIMPGHSWMQRGGFGPQSVSVTFSLTSPPAPFAYEVILRDGEREWPLGELTSDEHAIDAGGWGGGADAEMREVSGTIRGLSTRAVDLVLRPSAAAARRTVGVMEIYGGELVYEDYELEAMETGPGLGGALLQWLIGG